MAEEERDPPQKKLHKELPAEMLIMIFVLRNEPNKTINPWLRNCLAWLSEWVRATTYKLANVFWARESPYYPATPTCELIRAGKKLVDTFKFLWRTTRLSTQRVGPKGINLITPFMTLSSIKSLTTKKESSELLRQHSIWFTVRHRLCVFKLFYCYSCSCQLIQHLWWKPLL